MNRKNVLTEVFVLIYLTGFPSQVSSAAHETAKPRGTPVAEVSNME
jgi:hypothetical protein